MLKQIFQFTTPTESQFTTSNLRRLKWMTVLSFPYPIIAGYYFTADWRSLPSSALNMTLVLLLLFTIPVLFALSARMINRVWAPDSLLDESEIERKRISATFAFMTIIYGWLIAAPLLIVLDILNVEFPDGFGYIALLSTFIWGLLLQAYKLIQITAPVDAEDPDATSKKADHLWVWIVAGVIATMLALSPLAYQVGYSAGAEKARIDNAKDCAERANTGNPC